MKLITLNTWGGRVREPLYTFIQKHTDIDIFCLQEIYHEAKGKESDEDRVLDALDIFTDISKMLPEHTGYFRPSVGDYYGIAVFIKKDMPVLEEGEKFVHKYKGFVPNGDEGHHARNIQYVRFKKDDNAFAVINFHGLWNGKGKTDTEDRLMQSDNILEYTATLQNEFILCGDFNLLPDTQSVKKLEASGLRNLVTENGVTSTRTRFYTKPDKFADYIFTTKGVEVKDFKVLPDEVSDHAALYLEFNI